MRRATEVVVPFADVVQPNQRLKGDILAEIADIIDAGTLVNGPQVARFEEDFAAYCGREHCVGLSSGLDALRLALLGFGVAPGDEVILPANTFIATVEAVSQSGAQPVLVDVTEDDYNMDPVGVQAALTDRTRVLLPVHLYGQMADMEALEQVAGTKGVAIVEDACQAHGATRAGRRAGGTGTAGAFSFYPAKNLGALGDAGAAVLDDLGLLERIRALREHGQVEKHHHELEGWTARLDTIQAAALLHKLPFLDDWNSQRRWAASMYSGALEDVGDLQLPAVPGGSEPVWHVYVVLTANPEAVAGSLREQGIATGRHYPAPIHLTPAYAGLASGRGSFPVSEWIARCGLSLPIFPGIEEEQIERVVEAIRSYFDGEWS